MEDFGYQKDGEDRKLSDIYKRIFLVGATLFSIATFIYITVSAYYYVYQDRNANIETIKSPEEPIKTVEESQNSGSENSLQIDRSIYEDIFGNKKESLKASTAKIRTAPEPALPPKELVLETKPTVSLTEEKSPTAATASSDKQKIIVYSEKEKNENQKSTSSATKDLLTKTEGVSQEKAAVAENRKEIKTEKPEKKRAVRVQLAAMNSRLAAEENWKKLNNSYSSLFSGLKPFIEEVNLGKRGIFYRLQIGNFYNQPAAEEFCNRYVTQAHKNRADCIIVE